MQDNQCVFCSSVPSNVYLGVSEFCSGNFNVSAVSVLGILNLRILTPSHPCSETSDK